MGNCKFLSFLWNVFFCVSFVTSQEQISYLALYLLMHQLMFIFYDRCKRLDFIAHIIATRILFGMNVHVYYSVDFIVILVLIVKLCNLNKLTN